MITIHHLDNSRSERIVWLAEELGIAYELVTHLREQGMAPKSYKAIHGLGRAPVICDGEVTLMESGAICEYLTDRYGNSELKPSRDSGDYPRYLQWMHFAEGSAMAGLIQQLMLSMVAEGSPRLAYQEHRNGEVWQYIEDTLSEQTYFAGDQFSTADIMMEFDFTFLERAFEWDRGEYPNIARWLDLVRSRPAYIKAIAVAAPKVKLPFVSRAPKT